MIYTKTAAIFEAGWTGQVPLALTISRLSRVVDQPHEQIVWDGHGNLDAPEMLPAGSVVREREPLEVWQALSYYWRE